MKGECAFNLMGCLYNSIWDVYILPFLAFWATSFDPSTTVVIFFYIKHSKQIDEDIGVSDTPIKVHSRIKQIGGLSE